MKILVINGPNINMLGLREPAIYGNNSYADLLDYLKASAAALDVELELFQSNSEGAIVDIIQWSCGKIDGIVINPAAYTHTSVALLDALKAVSIPTVEVHLSDPNTREDFRHISFVRAACVKTIAGKGFEGYREAMEFLKEHITKTAQ